MRPFEQPGAATPTSQQGCWLQDDSHSMTTAVVGDDFDSLLSGETFVVNVQVA
jgi:hypothetical protein